MPQRMYEPAAVVADDPINLFTYAHEPLAIEGKSHVNEDDALFELAPVRCWRRRS